MARRIEANVEGVRVAAEALARSDVVAFPTETVYGLGASTFDQGGIRRIYDLKGRPRDNPLIAHVGTVAQARQLTRNWDDRCDRLAEHFWPGPLTLVLHRAEDVPSVAVAGLSTIAVRMPSHPVAAALLDAFGGPISAPSANRSGHISPTSADHVLDDFTDVDDLLVLDGGPCPVGIESTVLDVSDTRSRLPTAPTILRPGSITLEALRECLGDVALCEPTGQDISPGTRMRHYAPRLPARLVARDALHQTIATSGQPMAVITCGERSVPSPHHGFALPDDAAGYAAHLYEVLRAADRSGCASIIIESPPPAPEWLAARDRLSRAVAGEG